MTSSSTFDTASSTRLSGLSQIVGNTPLLEIAFEFRGKQRVIYAKSEQLNLTGSIKDRMALHILKEAYRSGATPSRRYHRRGHQRQHRNIVCCYWPRSRSPRQNLHAGLDESRA